MKKFSIVLASVLSACGVEENTIILPEPTVVEVPAPAVTPAPPKPVTCRVYAVDLHGGITYLSHDDRFYSNSLMAKIFQEDEAKNVVRLKNGKYNAGKSTVTAYCK